MNLTHLHMMITHLPIFGSILGSIVLIHALWTRSHLTAIAAYIVLIISSAGAVVAYLTGEEAEKSVESIAGIVKARIEEHEDAAIFALVFMSVVGVISIIGLFLSLKKSPASRKVTIITLIAALFTFTVVLRTGYLGGLIRHPEVNSNYIPENKSDEIRKEE